MIIKNYFMQEAYIVAGFRTAITKSKKGGFRFMRSDELAIEVIKGLMKTVPMLDHKLVDDVIVGNAVPEAEQGLQFGRMISAKALGIEVPGITINRYCASGLESIAMATAKIRTGMADCIIAGGTESMSMVPTAGWKTVPAYSIAEQDPDYYLSMGLTAEAVANEYKISREDQDAFALSSHQKAKHAIDVWKGLMLAGLDDCETQKRIEKFNSHKSFICESAFRYLTSCEIGSVKSIDYKENFRLTEQNLIFFLY